MLDFAHLFAFSISYKLRRQHQDDFLRRYYDEVKLIAGDKLTATFDQLRQLFQRQFAINGILMVTWIPTLQMILVKSQGEQKEIDEKRVLEHIKACFDDSMIILGS